MVLNLLRMDLCNYEGKNRDELVRDTKIALNHLRTGFFLLFQCPLDGIILGGFFYYLKKKKNFTFCNGLKLKI